MTLLANKYSKLIDRLAMQIVKAILLQEAMRGAPSRGPIERRWIRLGHGECGRRFAVPARGFGTMMPALYGLAAFDPALAPGSFHSDR